MIRAARLCSANVVVRQRWIVDDDVIGRHTPAAWRHRMCSTVMRVPAITGLPNMIFGSDLMREAELIILET